MATGTIAVHGLKELTRDFKKISKDLDKLMVEELQQAVEPVSQEAEYRALTMLHHMYRSPQWADMRVGISRAQGLVYIVPVQRGGKRGGRKNFASKWTETVEQVVEKNRGKVIEGLDEMIDRLGGKYNLD